MNEVKVNMENLTDEQQKQLMELIKTANEPKDRPMLLKPYFYIISTNEIVICCYHNTGNDEDRFKAGNAFFTEQEAKFEQEKRKVIAELKNYAKKHNGKIIDWENQAQDKWCFYYDYEYEKLKYFVSKSCREQGSIYFTSDIVCNNCVKEIGGDRIKKYLFEVK